MVQPDTYKADALITLHDADEGDLPMTSSEVGRRVVTRPSDQTAVMSNLYEENYVIRKGEGVRGDPYRYELTPKGQAAATDLSDDGDNGDAGIDALFGDEDPEATDDLADRIRGLEQVVGEANVEREDARHRLRQIEDALSGADHMVGLPDDDLVDAVYLIANSENGSYRKKTSIISNLIGVDTDDGCDADEMESLTHHDAENSANGE